MILISTRFQNDDSKKLTTKITKVLQKTKEGEDRVADRMVCLARTSLDAA